MTAIRHFNFTDSSNHHCCCNAILMKITVVVQFISVSSVTQSIVFDHSYNIRTLLVQLNIKLASVS